MHMAATDQSKAATRRFRWLYVARWAVASMVTVLAVAVIVRAVVVMLRPEKLQLKLAGGRVAVDWIPSMPPPRRSPSSTCRSPSPCCSVQALS